MLAEKYKLWSRDGGPLDIVAITAAIIIIAGGFFIVYSNTTDYRSRTPVASVAPVMGPSLVPTDEKPRQ
ncbi:MAG: hypothetical protein WCE79_02920 [Xanthobacteraceae bacterium]